jgi:sec-independent protein translocase protein TatA
MPHVTPVGLLIVLAIVLVLFGGGRVGKLGGELGTAIREFRRGLEGADDTQKVESTTGKNGEVPPTPEK